MQCGFVAFLRSPGGLEATKGPHSAARAYPTQRRHARLTRHDKTNAAPTGNASNGRRWVWACAHNIITDPRPTTPRSTPQRAKRAHERERRRPRQPQVPRRNSETRPRQDPDKSPTRPRRQPDDTSASKRQPFARINDDTQPNQRRPTSKGSRMRALARVREP